MFEARDKFPFLQGKFESWKKKIHTGFILLQLFIFLPISVSICTKKFYRPCHIALAFFSMLSAPVPEWAYLIVKRVLKASSLGVSY